jgi:hypothetical protein
MSNSDVPGGQVGNLTKFLLALLGSTLPLVIPFLTKYALLDDPSSVSRVAHYGVLSALAIMILTWAGSVVLTMCSKDRHPLSVFMGAMGLPGFITSLAIGVAH